MNPISYVQETCNLPIDPPTALQKILNLLTYVNSSGMYTNIDYKIVMCLKYGHSLFPFIERLWFLVLRSVEPSRSFVSLGGRNIFNRAHDGTFWNHLLSLDYDNLTQFPVDMNLFQLYVFKANLLLLDVRFIL